MTTTHISLGQFQYKLHRHTACVSLYQKSLNRKNKKKQKNNKKTTTKNNNNNNKKTKQNKKKKKNKKKQKKKKNNNNKKQTKKQTKNNIFKWQLLLNTLTNYNQTSQECCLGASLPK